MFDTRAWRGAAVVGGDGIELPRSAELAGTSPKPLKPSGFGTNRSFGHFRFYTAIGERAEIERG
jgi:hypothetical protein